MTTHIGRRNACAAWIATLGIALIAFSASAQDNGSNNQQPLPRYTVVDLGTLGGTYSLAGGLSNSGWVEGYSTLPDGNHHAYLWRNGLMTDLGTLGGPNSQAGFRPSDRGNAGGAQTLQLKTRTGKISAKMAPTSYVSRSFGGTT